MSGEMVMFTALRETFCQRIVFFRPTHKGENKRGRFLLKVYRYSSLSFEVSYDIEILTSNTYLAVILVYLNYLFAAYLLTVL